MWSLIPNKLLLIVLKLSIMIRKVIFFSLIGLLIPIIQGCDGGNQTMSLSTNDTDPASIQLFKQLPSSETGVRFNNNIQENLHLNYLRYDGLYMGGGVGIGDVNGDGLPDLYFTGNMVPDKLYLNKGNMKFEDITVSAGIVDDPNDWSTGVTMADVNNDGHLDIYVCKFLLEDNSVRQNHLYINNGDLTFSEKAFEYGISDAGFGIQANFFDYDKDGFLDLYVANQPPTPVAMKRELQNKRNYIYTDRLYHNNGDNTFSDATSASGITNYSFSLSATIRDMNRDGWPDIYVTCDYEEPDIFYQNNGDGTFTDIADDAIRHMSNFSMGADITDINNDGWFDIYTADMVAADNYRLKTNMSGMNPQKFWELANAGYHYQYMFNALQLNNGNGTYSEIGQLAGVSSTDWSWSTLFGDFDNDGFSDLHVTNGQLRDVRNNDYAKRKREFVEEQKAKGITELDPLAIMELAPSVKISNFIYKNNGDLTFTDLSHSWGHGTPTFTNGSAYGDLDGDGDLDLITNNSNDPAGVFENLSSDKNLNNYLRIACVGDGKNRNAIGTFVEIEYGNGEQQTQELFPVRGYMSVSESVIHFGLGKNAMVNKLTAIWPDGRKTVLTDLKVNQLLTLKQKDANGKGDKSIDKATLFVEQNNNAGINYKHTENEYDDYAIEILMPHKMSTLGPCLAKSDVNGDGKEDFFIGGPIGQSGEIYSQTENGQFQKITNSAFKADKNSEDNGALFFDVDGDGDADLYVVSGGNEYSINSSKYQDRLYLNDGKGKFTKAKGMLPKMYTSGSTVAASDFDQDGDLDLFVGGRQVPGKYGMIPKSYLLKNEGGKFKDFTNDLAEGLQAIGMVTTSLWMDYDGDQDEDLILAGEWMQLTCFENNDGKLTNNSKKVGFKNTEGWWNKLVSVDLDQDGDQDLIAGNLGLNIKYKATEDQPFTLYIKDFDNNGTHDVYLGYYEDGVCYPIRGRECSSQQMPFIKEEFKDYDKFGKATLDEILGARKEGAEYRTVKMFASSFIENKGDGHFELHKLPNEAQISPIFGIETSDLNGDGNLDILIGGNYYNREIETTRSDAGIGQILLGNGKNEFVAMPSAETGLALYKDVRAIEILNKNSNHPTIIVANNNDSLQVYTKQQVLQ
jgi:hypothetical protein